MYTMEITGFDTVIFSFALRVQVVRSLVDKVRGEWPTLIIDVHLLDTNRIYHDLISSDSCIDAIGKERHAVIFFYRDPHMRSDHEEQGYHIDSANQGPFAVHFRTRQAVLFELGHINERSSRDNSIGTLDPYPGWLCSPEILELSVVTPLNPDIDTFSQWAVSQVLASCL